MPYIEQAVSSRNVVWQPKDHYTLIEGTICQEYYNVINICAPNIRSSQWEISILSSLDTFQTKNLQRNGMSK